MKALLKAVSWETISTVITLVITWLAFGYFEVCLLLGVINFTIKILLFVVHDKLWKKI